PLLKRLKMACHYEGYKTPYWRRAKRPHERRTTDRRTKPKAHRSFTTWTSFAALLGPFLWLTGACLKQRRVFDCKKRPSPSAARNISPQKRALARGVPLHKPRKSDE